MLGSELAGQAPPAGPPTEGADPVAAPGVEPPPPRSRRIRRRPGHPLPEDASPLARTWWSVAGITVLLWAFALFGYVDSYPLLMLAVVALGLWGLGTILASWFPVPVDRRLAGGLAWATVGVVLGAFFLWSYLQVVSIPAYGTDEVAFDQYAAQLLLHGSNPYVHSMAPAFTLFHVSPNGYTFLLSGHPVTALSYPALSFLAYVPFLAAGWSTQMAIGVNVAAWALSIVLAFALLPRSVRPLALVVGSLGVYIAYAVGGVTDALFVPLVLGAVYQWDRFATTRGPWAWRGPLLLGLAMAVKQTPWLLLPFLAAGVGMEAAQRGTRADGLRTAGRYVALALGAFLLPNLAFVVWSPRAWWDGIVTPIASHAVPSGQGLVGLSLFLGVGGGSLRAYTVALVVVFVALLATYVATYPWLRAWAVALPAVVLFFGARSFGSYMISLLPEAIVAACTVGGASAAASATAVDAASRPSDGAPSPTGGSGVPSPGRPAPWRRWRWVVAGSAGAVVVAVVAVVASGPPLTVRIVSVRTTGQLATIVQVGVVVDNTTSHPLAPAFTIQSGGQLTAFWLPRGPSSVAPHTSARYTLLAPNFFAQPAITGGFQVVAFTDSPGTVSRSASYLPTTLHLSLAPDAVNRVVPLGQPVVVRAQVLDRLDRPVHLEDEPVYLGQIIYNQQGLIFGQAVINGHQQGATPVIAYTDRQGTATFTIVGTQVTQDPVYFEANLLNSAQFYPYGYSQILPIRFGR